MSDSALRLTMRELHRLVRSPLLWASLAGVSLVLGLIGPFGTYEAWPVSGRLGYWALVAGATYFTCAACVSLLEGMIFRVTPTVGGYAMLGAASGLPVATVVWSINWLVTGGDAQRAIAFVPLLVYATLIAAVVSALIALFADRLELGEGQDSFPSSQRPTLLDRLPSHLRGELLHLSMQDHYVEVNTDKGAHLLLMRMGDAIAEAGPADGLQIHRSHWLARRAIKESLRRGGRVVLRLKNGTELPVSRSHMAELKKAGLL